MGLVKVILAVVSSIFSALNGWPPAMKRLLGAYLRPYSSLATRSSAQNITSSAVNGAPSDHFMPGRRWKVYSVASSLTSMLLAALSLQPVMSIFQRTSPSWWVAWRLTSPRSAMVRMPWRQVPPYLPMRSTGVTTSGSSGSRSSTGGNSPAATRAASIGASW